MSQDKCIFSPYNLHVDKSSFSEEALLCICIGSWTNNNRKYESVSTLQEITAGLPPRLHVSAT